MRVEFKLAAPGVGVDCRLITLAWDSQSGLLSAEIQIARASQGFSLSHYTPIYPYYFLFSLSGGSHLQSGPICATFDRFVPHFDSDMRKK
jgi:hypothetical protein